ncbi:RimJ/RimL family protein N-acetyltransferase [Kribbella amoyensis]|uniref:RimJ/RimL family protein N-acetyltransferase n=1 Tax=Kribbella amoyensis TaxID=996641 RepID=A0A561BPG2_9ACTN|nr:GNAT family N-acetyltransferase [Kribbella amoyensis]TWD80693.1 RimJ/RimL family protein N-acetyltransferase [Kribbella amoyensis]
MREVDCVGALIRDDRQRVYVQRRSATRRLLPGIWDIVGGHVEAGETPEQTLAREVEEETGWKVREILAPIADWEWEYEGRVRRELDYLITVDGDLTRPWLEEGKHDANAWVGPDDLELLMVGRTDGDRRLRDIVAATVRTRLTERLRLEPVTGPGEVHTGHAEDLVRVFADPWVAQWYGEPWSAAQAVRRAAAMQRGWEEDGASKWMAYERDGGSLVGRGGLSRIPAGSSVADRIADLLRTAPTGGEAVAAEWTAGRVEVGWSLVTEARGRGLATEIGRAGLAYAFETLGVASVIAFTERHNAASRAVMERLGMTEVGEIAAEGLAEGSAELRPDAPFAVYLADQNRT